MKTLSKGSIPGHYDARAYVLKFKFGSTLYRLKVIERNLGWVRWVHG